MKVFISWSGNTSHKIACVLRDWLPTVIYHVEPWVSSEDIKKGDRWSIELFKQLDETQFGIICIDNTNANSPWLNFEAGALSKSIENGRVFPILFGVSPIDLKGPIAQFQVTTFEKDDFYKLIRSLNLSLQSLKIDPERLMRSFEIACPGLINAVSSIQLSSRENSQREKSSYIDRQEIQTSTDSLSLESISFRIIYIDELSEHAVRIKRIMTKAGCKVELMRLRPEEIMEKHIAWNGHLFYRFPGLLEAAIDAKNLAGKLITTIQQGEWSDEDLDLAFWLSSET